MALTNCKECDAKVSLTADSCPHCGSKDFIDHKRIYEQEISPITLSTEVRNGLILIVKSKGPIAGIIMLKKHFPEHQNLELKKTVDIAAKEEGIDLSKF